MASYLVEHAFAGLWTLVWHFGVGIGLIILLLAAAWFVPSVKAKILFCGIALVIGALVVGEGLGVHMEKVHVDAQQAATNNFVSKTVKSTTTAKSRGTGDPWDRRNY